jgi:hypothetical protein
MNFQKFTTFKTILIALVLTINANQLFAQTTNGIFFQAVARDNFSNPAKDRKIFVQSSIIQTTPTGTKVLTEEHQANTDATGVFSISLGNGVRVGGTASGLTTIDWSKGPFYLNLKVAITPIGGNSSWDYNKEWVDMGTTSFGAVPFALYSASSAKVDDKLNANDTTKMLAVYAKAIKVQSLETAVASKLTAADTLTMLAPYAKAAYTIDSSFFKSQLATKLSIGDTILYTKKKYTDSAFLKKLNIADSSIYVTKSQLASYNFSSSGTTTTTTSVTMDTTSLSNRINLKAAASDLINLNTTVTSNTASITANTSSISSLTNNITSNTASITANATAINLKAPVASPLFTGTVGIGTTNPSSAAALDITSTTQGLLLPRLTYVQKTAISNPVAGLILFCSDCGTSGEMQLYNGTSFVNMIGGTAQLALPVISSTTGAYSITTSSAISGGVITSDGGASITARGLVWGTSAGSTTYSITTGTGTGTFTSSITGLTSGITYYIRAFATNSVGTKYGSEITLNTAQAVATLAATTTVSDISSTTATSGGNITYNGGATVTVSGIVWSTTSTPTIALATKTTNGAASGTYISNITGLTPGTLYYVRSYATNSVGTNYGAQTSFTTLNTATIAATVSATSITSNTATTGGDITADGGATVTSRGLVYGTTTGSATFSVTSGTGTGTYSIGLTGLTPATTYYVRSFATNSVGTVYGTETNFTTIAVEPTVSATAVAASITGSSATSGGTISSNGGSIVTVSGVVWSTTSTPTIALLTKTTNGAATGTYTSSITGLAPATLYYVRAYATNSIGTAYGPQSNFTTLAIAPIISGTASATSITSSSASVGGTITEDGGAAVTVRGVVYGTSSLSSTFSVTSGTGTGTYTIGLTGLSPATTYYVRSFATNSVGTVYGTETNFTTIAIAPTLTTSVVSSITKYAASAGGTITSNGGSAITVSGICWSTTSTPTISDSKTTDGTTSGTFTSSLTGLTAGTTYYVRAYATNAIGTGYGPNESFTTLSTSSNNPALDATTTATSITANSAILGGNITDEGATQVSARGLVYGTTTGSATYSVTVGSGAGTFTSTLTGLSQGTTYFARSFATNVQGTSYGAETSFTTQTIPTVSVTATPTSITTTTAIGGGTISSTGGATITTSGLVWGASTNPEITLTTKTTNGATSGTFTSSITGLTQGTTYHVRAYATNYLGTTYGPNITFTTITTPTVSATATVTSITGTTATSGGTISLDGGATVTSRGLVYGTSSLSSTFSVTSGTGTGTYSIGLTGLTPATTYYVRSFATNSVGTVYGTETNFTTIAVEPTVSATAVAASITGSSATSGGTISSNGGSTVTVSGIVWSTTSTPTIALSTKTTNGAATGTYTSSITGLAPATLYYVRAYATNSIGTAFGPQNNFTTLAIAPTISATATVISITGTTATSGGTITVDGGATVTSRGVVWGTTTGSSTFSATSGTGTGTYPSNLSGLSIATTYFVRAFATNSAGTSYGPEVQFATPNTATVASTITSTITSSTAILGGVLSSTGGATTAIGIMYSTSSSFGTYSTTTINANAVAGTYTTSISGLSELTTYYVKAFATNTAGTTYGPTINFSTPVLPLTVGTTYQGGIIFYLFQSGEPGYVAGQTHGLIASTSDQSTYTDWKNNGGWNDITTGTGIGTGLANTNAIIASHGSSATYAAGRARAHNGGGYTDWYLPSRDELYKMHITIGQGANNIANLRSEKYWSSSQYESHTWQAYYMYAQTGNVHTVWKDVGMAVRAIRTF